MVDNIGSIKQSNPPFVVAECPLCPWHSGEYEYLVTEHVNGEWYARQAAASEYRQHADVHRPLPRFVRTDHT